MRAALILALLVPLGAAAQGFTDEPTCYNWEGGHKSAGSFSKCGPRWEAPVKKAPLPPPVVTSPVMMPMAAPVTCAPAPKPVLKKKRPAPKKC
jgi:hypothetical protein